MPGDATGVPPSAPLYWWVVGWLLGRGRRICSLLLRELVSGVCSSLLASVGVGCWWSMACVQGTWWGVGGGVVGGWRGFWFWCQVSGRGWLSGPPCLVGGGVRLVGPGLLACGWCGVRGAVPLRPLLNSRPHLLGGLWALVRVVPLLGGAGCSLVGVCVLQFFSDGVGCCGGWLVLLAEFWSGLFSTWGRGCGSRWSFRFGRAFVVVGSRLRAPWVVFRVGRLFSCWLCRFRWVGRPGRSGSPPPPSFSPHGTRRRLADARIRWANSHVKTLTDRRSSVSGTHAFRLYRTV